MQLLYLLNAIVYCNILVFYNFFQLGNVMFEVCSISIHNNIVLSQTLSILRFLALLRMRVCALALLT